MNIENEIKIEEKEVVSNEEVIKDPSILEINVHDSVSGKDLGPGQRQ